MHVRQDTFDGVPTYRAKHRRVTERYRRSDFGHLEIEVTLSDPKAYAKPWTVVVGAELAADTEMLEWACNESDQHVERWVGKASDERKREVKVDPGILAKYVGTYGEQPPLWRGIPRTVVVTMTDGTLFANMDGRGAGPAAAVPARPRRGNHDPGHGEHVR